MRPCYAAALVLVGWYLMLPPVFKGIPHSSDPLGDWIIFDSFDKASECKAAKDKRGNEVAGWVREHALKEAAAAQWEESQCIASDDPRLKEK
jgi:hypothetical protein